MTKSDIFISDLLRVFGARVPVLCGLRPRQAVAVSSFLIAALVLSVLPASASPLTSAEAAGLNLGTDSNYAVVDMGSGETLGQNVRVNGNELLGNNVTAAFSGGGQITGTLSYDASVKGTSTFSQLSGPVTTQLVSGPGSGTVTGNALATAQSVSTYASSLAATQTFASLSAGQTITGVAGLNVIDVTGGGTLNNVTVSGPAGAYFVFNVGGDLSANMAMELSGGVSASDILWNLTATSGNILSTSGCSGTGCGLGAGGNGESLYGTFLATNGGGYQFSNLDLDGQLINTDGNIQLVSGSEIPIFSPLTVPEPASIALFASALVGFAAIGRRYRRKPVCRSIPS